MRSLSLSAVILAAITAAVSSASASTAPSPRVLRGQPQTSDSIPDEAWDYVEVRPGAQEFWWLYGATNTAERPRTASPLVVWLQGGPGASSTGYGNFYELGPLNEQLEPRNTTWIQAANVLFIDNPVGTGYSYVEDESLYATTNEQIADDLVTLLTAFLKRYPAFASAKTPLYIFSESYGGKMNTGFAHALLRAIDADKINVNFRGIALGDSWISAEDYVLTWGPYLYGNGQIDASQLKAITKSADECVQAVHRGDWEKATNLWGDVENVVLATTDGVSFYNVLDHNSADAAAVSFKGAVGADAIRSVSPSLGANAGSSAARLLGAFQTESLSALMNGPIRAKLGIIPSSVQWGGQSAAVFAHLSGDFMKSVAIGNNSVDTLLKQYGDRITVTVYNGQLDLICDSPGTEAWMKRLTWDGMSSFYAASKSPLYAPTEGRNTAAFVKSHGPLTMYYINRAGHMVPHDQGPMALEMLRQVTGQSQG